MKSTLINALIAGVTGLITVITPGPDANAQAYCALRDPVSQIYKVCPQASSYRSVVRTIDEAARDLIVSTVPYPMHFTELGRHTLYVGLNGSYPVGLVQSRSERSRWGLVEVVWAFDLDLKITGFTLQRCRARSADRAVVESDAFQSLVVGRSFNEMVDLLSEDGKALNPEAAALVSGKPDLAVAVLRCGIKTLAATQAAWRDDVAEARLWRQALTYFPEAVGLARVDAPYTPAVMERLMALFPSSSAVQRDAVKMYGVRDANDQNRGVIVFTDCRFGKDQLGVWWGIDADQTLRGAQAAGDSDPLVAAVLDDLRGHGLSEIDDVANCADPLKLVAAEVLVSAVHHLGGE